MGSAAANLQRLLDRVPEQPAALQLLGVATFQSGRGDEAVRLMQRAIAAAPAYAEAHYNLANMFLFRGQLTEGRPQRQPLLRPLADVLI